MEPGSHMKKYKYKAIVIGVSAGGLAALSKLFPCLPDRFPLPVIIVQHVGATANRYKYAHFDNKCILTIKEADDKEEIRPGFVYFAPPDYHLLIERDETFSLSVDAKVNYSRPSIDVLFESAVYVWSSSLIGILLTGASSDGAHGMRLIKEHGGLTIVQDPATAEYPVMPKAAIDAVAVNKILSIESIGEFLKTFSDTLDKGHQK